MVLPYNWSQFPLICILTISITHLVVVAFGRVVNGQLLQAKTAPDSIAYWSYHLHELTTLPTK